MINLIPVAISLIFLAETERGAVLYDQKGCLQITSGCLRDVNRINAKRGGKQYDLSDRLDFAKSQEIAEAWLGYYKPIVERSTGKPMTAYDLATMWNVGMVGLLRGDGQAYRNMIQRKLALLKPTDALIVALRKA
jgi:hypothetical protein